MSTVIEAKGLRKCYDRLTAVDGIDFSVPKGICFGFLGPNGAGKTTTVKMTQCILPLTSGDLKVFDMDVGKHPREIKYRIGVCHQDDTLDPDFPVLENLLMFSRFFSISKKIAQQRIHELLSFMGLWERRSDGVRELSGGLKRRLMIARALINEPELIILDEPTTGLDPQSRHQVWDRIRKLRSQGKTILLTTHYMDEAQSLCDRLLIIDHGKILVEGRPHELIREGVGKEVVEVWNYSPALVKLAQKNSWNYDSDHDRLFVYTENGEETLRIISKNYPLERYTVRPANLEDLFLKLTGRELRE